MTHLFTAHFHTRQYELNSHGELPNSTLQRLFQETATLATRDAGFDVRYHQERESIWVVYQMTLEHLHPIRYPDELAIATWLCDAQKVRTHREYLARNAATGETVARGRAHWVHLHAKTLRPLRIPQELFDKFQQNGVSALVHIEPRLYPAPQFDFPVFRATRRVYRYEADEVQHVNNAMYIDWLEEALADAIAMQWNDARRLCVYRHDVEYVRSAVPGDDVEIIVRLIGVGKTACAWNLDIKRGDETLVRDRITALWVDRAGTPVKW
jgi:acyl-CoA thioesterase FadM